MKFRRFSLMVGSFLLGLSLLLPFAETGAFAKSALDEILEKGVVRVGFAVWPPFSYVDKATGQYAGIYRDVGEELAEALGVKAEYIEDSTATLIAGLQGGKFDVTLQLAVTLSRAKAVGFTNPLLKYQASLLVKNDSPIKKWQEANDPKYTIAVSKGSNTALYVEKMFPKANELDVKETPQGILAIKAGRAQSYASSYDTLLEVAKRNPDLRVLKDCFIYNPMGFTTRKDDQVFINWLNWFIEDLKVTHTIHKILGKHGARQDMVADTVYK